LRELAEPAGGGFGWGYNGTGPLRVAAAILADALSLGDPAGCGLDPFSPWPDTTLTTLRGDFTWDVTFQLCEEWRLRRGAVLRWVRDWCAEHASPACPRQLPSCRPLAPIHAPARTGPGPARNLSVLDTGRAWEFRDHVRADNGLYAKLRPAIMRSQSQRWSRFCPA
jgi:hypothetical protein